MANTLLTITGVTKKALQLFRNANAFLQSINTQFDDSFGVSGAKIGTSLKIRKPNDYTVRTGATASVQNTTEDFVTLTVATQKGVDVSFSSNELALSMDQFSDRVLAPMVNTLAGGVAADVMTMAEGIPNVVHATDGSSNTVSPTMNTFLAAGAMLDQYAAPRGDRVVILDPLTQARTVSTLAGLFNNSADISKQYKTGLMGTNVLGFAEWKMDQTTLLHTTAAYSTLGTFTSVNAAGTTVTCSALAGPLTAGDIITFVGANAVNPVTKATTGILKHFVVTANAAGGATSISIYPPIISAAGAYQTVSAAPTGGGQIASPIKASEVYRKNFAFSPAAMTLVTAPLDLPTGAVVDASRQTYDGISLRMVRDYVVTTDTWLTRLDILYGFGLIRPEWAVVIADAV